MKSDLRKLIANFAKRDSDKNFKGAVGELFARKWFERHEIEYFQFPQCQATIPLSLARAGGKRPDFAITLRSSDSLVYIDAKFHKTKDVTEFALKDEELLKFKVFREWIRTECGDDGDRDILLMLYPQELDGEKFMWIHLDELLDGLVTDVDGMPGRKVLLADRKDFWMHQDDDAA